MTPGPFDFPSAERPSARALQDSFVHDEIEAELRALFLEVFERLSADAFDADVMGAPHLGSFGLVQRMVNHDGLVLLRGEREQAATRYLYRAWRSGDAQKRGLHFLRTYLQLLFPNQVQVRQLWHDSRFPYGEAFRANEPREQLFRFLSEPSLRLDGAWKLGQTVVPLGAPPPIYRPDAATLFLTSRLDIVLSLEAISDSAYLLPGSRRSVLGALLEVIRAIVPARLTPMFRFWLAFALDARVWAGYRLRMSKSVDLRFPWCGRVIAEADEARWSLGRNPWPVKLPQPFGTFRVGELRGDPWAWRLRNCRIEAPMLGRLESSAEVYRTATLEPWRRLNGSWVLSQRRSTALTAAHLRQRATVDAAAAISTTHHDWIRLHYPRTPTRLGRMLLVDGRWRLGAGETLRSMYCAMSGSYLDGCRPRGVLGTPQLSGRWQLARASSIPAESTGLARLNAPIHVRPDRLPTNPRHACIRAAQPYRLGLFALLRDGAPRPIVAPERRLRLDGWPLGRPSAPQISMLARRRVTLPIEPVSVWAGVRRHAIHLPIPAAPTRLGAGRCLDGRWRVEQGERLSMALRGPTLSGWALGRNAPVSIERRADLSMCLAVTATPAKLARQYSTRLQSWPRRLDGQWALGGVAHIGRFRLNGVTALKNRKITQFHRLGTFTLRPDHDAARHWPVCDERAQARCVPRLNGAWGLGGPAEALEASIRIIKRDPRTAHG